VNGTGRISKVTLMTITRFIRFASGAYGVWRLCSLPGSLLHAAVRGCFAVDGKEMGKTIVMVPERRPKELVLWCN
jgi:hypothetical protein